MHKARLFRQVAELLGRLFSILLRLARLERI